MPCAGISSQFAQRFDSVATRGPTSFSSSLASCCCCCYQFGLAHGLPTVSVGCKLVLTVFLLLYLLHTYTDTHTVTQRHILTYLFLPPNFALQDRNNNNSKGEQNSNRRNCNNYNNRSVWRFLYFSKFFCLCFGSWSTLSSYLLLFSQLFLYSHFFSSSILCVFMYLILHILRTFEDFAPRQSRLGLDFIYDSDFDLIFYLIHFCNFAPFRLDLTWLSITLSLVCVCFLLLYFFYFCFLVF